MKSVVIKTVEGVGAVAILGMIAEKDMATITEKESNAAEVGIKPDRTMTNGLTGTIGATVERSEDDYWQLEDVFANHVRAREENEYATR